MNQIITPGDTDFAKVQAQFEAIMREMDVADRARMARSDESFRAFMAKLLRTIAAGMGFVIANLSEFVKDLQWSWQSGWADGIERAHHRRLRPHD